MKLYSTMLTISLLAAFSASGSNIRTSDKMPSAGDFASDSVNTKAETELRVTDNIDSAGQSFTLGKPGDGDYQLNSITFLASGTSGSKTESAVGLTIRLYKGKPGDDGTNLSFTSGKKAAKAPFYEFTFTSGTFDTTAGSYITFEFDADDIAAMGNLTAGTEYAFSVGVDSATETGNPNIDFRFQRDNSNGYAKGAAFVLGRVLDGADPGETQNGDAVFVINATAVPEPSSAFLSALAGLALLVRRRRS